MNIIYIDKIIVVVSIQNIGVIMKEKARKLLLLAMQAEYDETIVLQIENLLKDIYETNNIELKNDLDEYLNNDNYIYIPINIDNKLHSYYQIERVSGCFAELLSETLSLVLSQMYKNIIMYYESTSNHDIDTETNVFSRNSFENFKKSYNYLDYQSIGIIFVDINEMNEINNQYGHLIGDKVILNVATLLKEIFINDKVYRIGGDEFIVVLIDKNEEFINENISKVKNILKDNEIYVSIGECHGQNILDLNYLINEADKRMYVDKKKYYDSKGLQLRKRYHK